MITRQRKQQNEAVAEETVQIVTFRVGAEEYGLAIDAIIEAIRLLKVTPLPRMPRFIEGVINLRGTIIPVVDLRKRFCLTEVPHHARSVRMLITRGASPGGELLALIVDGVGEVLHLPKKQIEPAPRAAAGPAADFLAGVGKAGDRLIIIVDITRILSQQERTALAEADHA